MTESYTDSIGRQNEIDILEDLTGLGFKDYITHDTKPYSPSLWKKTRGKGVDLIFKIGPFNLYVEVRNNTFNYPIRTNWFMDSSVPRFRNVEFDYFNKRIILTNRPQNYNSVKKLAEKFAISVMNFEELIRCLNYHITLAKEFTTTTNNIEQLTSNSKLIIRVCSLIENSKVNSEFIDSNQLERVRQAKKLEKLRELEQQCPYLTHIPECWLD